MIVLRYSRLGTRRFISHIDVLREFGRIVRRADIPVGYSGGFNPHALLFFAPPTRCCSLRRPLPSVWAPSRSMRR